ncbi:ribokinase [Anaerococcus sp. AGMB09787]|uniref:ribokinase n=1 Tax=Anaerococcus sp. AGMB09787 TaxID=2922869 RepID=UPI001FAF2791
MKILNFGSINIDKVFSLDHIVRPGETIDSKTYEEKIGGKGLNQSVALAKVSDQVYHAGKLNYKDSFIVEYLKINEVKTDFIKMSDKLTGSAFIQVDKNGENSIVLDHGANFAIDKEEVDYVLASFGEGDILILQNEINNLSYIIDEARKNNMLIVLNPSPINSDLLEIDLNLIDLIIMNEYEARQITNKDKENDIISTLKETYPNTKFVITRGRQGSIYFDKELSLSQEIYEVDTIDTTGAGDTFTGYFVGLISKGYEIKECLKYASAASALAVTQKGASNSIPDFNRVEQFLEESL